MLLRYCECTYCHWIIDFKVVKMVNFTSCMCYGLHCVPPTQIHMMKPWPPMWYGIWRWGCWEMIRCTWGHEGGAFTMGLALVRRDSLCHVRTQSTSREEGSHQNLTMPPPWSRTSQPPTARKQMAVIYTTQVYGILLQQAEQRQYLLPRVKRKKKNRERGVPLRLWVSTHHQNTLERFLRGEEERVPLIGTDTKVIWEKVMRRDRQGDQSYLPNTNPVVTERDL